MSMSIGYHANITFGALKRWFVSQCYDSLAVAAMWLIALLVLHVPFAPLWALLAGALQFVPNFGLVLALIGPAMSILFTGAQWERFIGLLIAYALIAVIDGLLLQPSDEAAKSRAVVGVNLRAHPDGIRHSVLGSVVSAADAGCVLRLSQAYCATTSPFRQRHHTAAGSNTLTQPPLCSSPPSSEENEE
jgi:hypothetical protein